MHQPQHTHATAPMSMAEGNVKSHFPPFTMWIPGIKFRSSGLAASALLPTEKSHQPPKAVSIGKTKYMHLRQHCIYIRKSLNSDIP